MPSHLTHLRVALGRFNARSKLFIHFKFEIVEAWRSDRTTYSASLAVLRDHSFDQMQVLLLNHSISIHVTVLLIRVFHLLGCVSSWFNSCHMIHIRFTLQASGGSRRNSCSIGISCRATKFPRSQVITMDLRYESSLSNGPCFFTTMSLSRWLLYRIVCLLVLLHLFLLCMCPSYRYFSTLVHPMLIVKRKFCSHTVWLANTVLLLNIFSGRRKLRLIRLVIASLVLIAFKVAIPHLML